MTSNDEFRAIKCPNCGAPMTLTGDRETCNYCGTIIERREADEPERDDGPAVQTVQVTIGPTTAPKPGPVKPIFRIINCLLIVAMVILGVTIAGLVFYVIQSGEASQVVQKIQYTAGSNGIYGHPILLSPEAAQASDFLALMVNWESETKSLAYVDGETRNIRWKSPGWRESSYWYHVVAIEDWVYLAQQTSLQALDRHSGSVIWQATLSDEISTACRGCLQLVEGQVIALTNDGRLHSFEAESGRLAWEERLFRTPRHLLTVGGKLMVTDKVSEDKPAMAIKVFTPSDGSLQEQITPTCPSKVDGEQTSVSSLVAPLIYDPAAEALYVFGDGHSTCLQRWEASSWQPIWQAVLEDELSISGMSHDSPPILANGHIYASSPYNQGQLVIIDALTGSVRQVSVDADYGLTPLAVHDGVLLAMATRTRGTEREDLWGLDAASGERLWQYLPQAKSRFGEAGSDGKWDWHLTPAGLTLLQVLPEPDRLTLETLDMQTGRSAGQQTLALSDDFWTGVAWTDELVWLNIRGLQAVDLATGTLVYTWP